MCLVGRDDHGDLRQAFAYGLANPGIELRKWWLWPQRSEHPQAGFFREAKQDLPGEESAALAALLVEFTKHL